MPFQAIRRSSADNADPSGRRTDADVAGNLSSHKARPLSASHAICYTVCIFMSCCLVLVVTGIVLRAVGASASIRNLKMIKAGKIILDICGILSVVGIGAGAACRLCYRN